MENYTTINVYYSELTCIKYRRDIYMTWDTLLSQFGGIFGLCLGGSMITFVELFYAFSLKFLEYIQSGKSIQKPKGFNPPSYKTVVRVNNIKNLRFKRKNPFLLRN